MPKRRFPSPEVTSPTRAGEYAPTNTPAGSEHRRDSNIDEPYRASADFDRGSERQSGRHITRRQVVGASAVAVVATSVILALGLRGSAEENSDPGGSEYIGTVPTEQDVALPTSEVQAIERLDVQIPTVQSGEYYPAPPVDSPEAMLQSLCDARTAGFNSRGETFEDLRTDVVSKAYGQQGIVKYSDDLQVLNEFYQRQLDDPDLQFYWDCKLLDARGGFAGALWAVNVEETGYILAQDGTVIWKTEPQTKQWDLRSEYVTFEDGTSELRGVIGTTRPIAGYPTN